MTTLVESLIKRHFMVRLWDLSPAPFVGSQQLNELSPAPQYIYAHQLTLFFLFTSYY